MEAPQPPSVTRRAHNAQGCDPPKKSALYMWSWIILGIEWMEVLALCWLNIVVTQRLANRYSILYLPRALSVISNDLGFILLCFFHLKQYFCREEAWGERMKPFPTMVLFYIWVVNQLKTRIELITR